MTDKTPMQELLDYIGNKELKPLADVIRKEFIPKEQEFAGKVFDAGKLCGSNDIKFSFGKISRAEWEATPDTQDILDKYYKP